MAFHTKFVPHWDKCTEFIDNKNKESKPVDGKLNETECRHEDTKAQSGSRTTRQGGQAYSELPS